MINMNSDKIRETLLHKTRKHIRPILKNSKTASYITITLTLFCLSFFGLFAIRPTMITAISLIKEVNDLRDLSIRYENKISNFITAQTEYEKIRDSISLIDAALPENSEFPTMAKTVENLALKNEIKINQFQIDSAPISQPSHDEQLKNFNYIMIGIGNYNNIHLFIDDLLNNIRIVSINSLDFSAEGGTVSGLLRVSIKGKTYYEP